jgi:hypothetical protein
LIQQFTHQLQCEPEEYSLFPGDGAFYKLVCSRCKRDVSAFESLGTTMFHAPSAILNHLNILPSDSEEMESDIICKSVPLIFTSENNYSKSTESFLELIKADGWNNELRDECRSVSGRLGEFNFFRGSES